jgi:regulator of sigma E protease
LSILIGIIIFGIIVLVHEWGHFIVARMNGILVEEFAIGLGPKLFSTTKGDTMYSIRALPLGGYCKMLGEDSVNEDPRAFNSKKVSQRIAVVLAGAIMNFILAFIIFSSIALAIGYGTPIISGFSENSPAQNAGLQINDKIIKINNSKINIFEDLSIAISSSKGEPMQVTYKRDGITNTTTIKPFVDETNAPKIGITSIQKQGLLQSTGEFETIGLIESWQVGYYKLTFWIKVTINGIIDLFTFNISLDQMAGPIGVITVIDTIYDETKINIMDVIINMANFAGLLSVSIGAFNLMPIPALDGGRLVFLIIEGIRRKPIPEELEGRVHFVGFVLLMGLALIVAYQDILKLF